MKKKNLKVAIIGLGYVGLPLAIEFGKKRNIIGYDNNNSRIESLKKGVDKNLEFTTKEIEEAKIHFTSKIEDLNRVNCFIITVPTPIDKLKKPDLKPLLKATATIAEIIKENSLVIFESTVYPGCIEEKCVPILEQISKLKFNKNFFCGYSPERINPGDKFHKISNIKKITSGSNPQITNLVDELYKEIITAGTHKVSKIKIAEAAKVIENTQRDLNIALINEFAIIFNKLNIDTHEVLEAASSKWNFLNFKPGLVGGHCIGVDPYYLSFKAEQIGYSPKIILAGRRVNDNMGFYVVSELIKHLKIKNIRLKKSRVLIMGLTFKENCPDIRNTRVIDIVKELKKNKVEVDVYDPLASDDDANKEYKIKLIKNPPKSSYEAVIVAVAHDEFKKIGIKKIKKFCKKKSILYDLKNVFLPKDADLRL